ncbi:MAG: SufS family cysteine desulfurase [Simkaniaceae bacterium]|nr:SufS family cysteine desulfurase [Simkaniaceae bacterium]
MSQKIKHARFDFPMCQKGGVYLDNAATTYKPQCVIDAITNYYTNEYATINRSVYAAATAATEKYEGVRKKVSQFINAPSPENIVFVKSTTDGLNLLSEVYAEAFMKAGDEVIISSYEHHANIVPWQLAEKRHGIVLKVVPPKIDGTFDLNAFEKMLTPRTRLVSIAHVTNTTGYTMPLQEIVSLAHSKGVHVAVDGAQAVGHMPLNMQTLDVDFYTFSAHKMYGPTGVGVLYGIKDLLEKLPPYQGGGDMIDHVTFEKTTFQNAPYRFEPGTPNIAGVIGLGAAIDYLTHLGLTNIHDYEISLMKNLLNDFPDIEIHSQPNSSIVTFTHKAIHPLDLATSLSLENIAVRTGHLCAQPITQILGQPHLIRASAALYTSDEDIKAFRMVLKKTEELYTLPAKS